MLIIGLGTHQRGDLLLPLYPVAALVAAGELDRLTKTWKPPVPAPLAAITGVLAIAGFFYKYHTAAKSDPAVQLTARYHDLADQLLAKGGSGFPFTHCDDLFAVNFYLHTMRPLHVGPRNFPPASPMKAAKWFTILMPAPSCSPTPPPRL